MPIDKCVGGPYSVGHYAEEQFRRIMEMVVAHVTGIRRVVEKTGRLGAELFSGMLDVLYPRWCAGCGTEVGGGRGHLCWDCMASLTYIQDPFCSHCGDPVPGMVHHKFECSWCRDTKPAFAKARSAVHFHGVIRDMLHDFKYHNQTHLAVDLGNILTGCITAYYADIRFDGIVYVPLHPRKARERSFNQAELLAVEVGRRLGVETLRRALRRVRFTSTQTHLNASERKENVRGAFEVRLTDWIAGRRILLVDDVMTTGATVNECAFSLMKSGALSVYVATVARG